MICEKTKEIPKSVKKTFAGLPKDQYIKEEYCFRGRCYSTAEAINGKITYTEKSPTFQQCSTMNKYLGGIERQYERLSSIAEEFVKESLIPAALAELPKGNYDIGIHQIRTTANDDNMGKPAPEGVHQDGFDHIMIACCGGENLAGGNSLLVENDDYGKILFERVLEMGDCILFSDKQYSHYVSPIVPKLPGQCSRDVFVLTFLKKE